MFPRIRTGSDIGHSIWNRFTRQGYTDPTMPSSKPASPRWLLPALVFLASSQFAYSQGQTLLIPALPSSLNPRTAYVVADKGQAYLYDSSAGLNRVPFLSGVHRSFGFSYNGRYFLYSKSNGALPGFSLYRIDLSQKIENSVASGIVCAATSSASQTRVLIS